MASRVESSGQGHAASRQVGSSRDGEVRSVAILGSTGSIGCSTLDVLSAAPHRWNLRGMSAHSQLEKLQEQARQFHPRWVVATDEAAAAEMNWSALPDGTELLLGAAGIEKIAADPEVDIVVAAIVGSAGLRGAWAALDAGKPLALANKETLVLGGPLVTQLAARRNVPILPVDSEHSAIFQALQNGRREEVRRLLLTASGGPFRNHSRQQLEEVTVEQALAHPTWDMGAKITVDSATMMNKALEVIEARWLFQMPPEQIDVVLHPQSVVHSMVEYIDGSVIAQLSPPDMKLPIQYALTYPERIEGPAERLDFSRSLALNFEPPDFDRFPALPLGFEVAAAGGTAGAVLNAANEAAVAAFLDQQIRFPQIVSLCRTVLEHHQYDPNPTLEDLIQQDQWARQEVHRCIGS